ncbi:MAG: hypothetical protein ACO1QR_06755 [Chthoniobacteraceae bacterium]
MANPARAARVYYVNQPEGGSGEINAVNPDGTGHQTLYTTPAISDLRGIAVDPAGARLFYAHAKSNSTAPTRTEVSIRSLPITGGAPVVLAELPDGVFMADVEWDERDEWIYFAQTGTQQLRRLKPDGSGLATVITTIGAGQGPYFFGLDLLARNAYWGIGTESGQTNTAFSRGSLDTGVIDPTFSLVTPSRTRDIAVDRSVPGGMIYWCDRQNGAVYRQPVEGGERFTVRTGLNAPHGLVLDTEAGKGYVADTGKRGNGSQASSHRVVRFNLDGTGPLEFLSPQDSTAEPWDLAADFTSSSYADWKTRFFAADSLVSGPGNDPDEDGVPNYAEYGQFTHPERADAVRPQLVRVQGRDLAYARRRQTDIGTRVEVSTDLETWHWNGDTAGAVWTEETATSARDGDSVWVSIKLSPAIESAPHVFVRIRPSVPPPAAKPAATSVRFKRVKHRSGSS